MYKLYRFMRITNCDQKILKMIAGWPADTWREAVTSWFTEHGDCEKFRIPYMLKTERLYWPKVTELNDPFDGSIQIASNASYELVRERIKILNENNKFTPDEITRLKNEYGDDYLSDTASCCRPNADPNIGIEICRAATQRLIDEARVLSFSENWNNILMWSHYADSHKGFCLGFSVNDKARNTFFKNVCYPPSPEENARPTINLSKEEFLNYKMAEKAIFVKSHDWKYEDEVRLVDPWGGSKYYNLCNNRDSINLSEIIYGSRMCKETRKGIERIIEHLGMCDVTRFNAEMNKVSFVMDRANYSESI